VCCTAAFRFPNVQRTGASQRYGSIRSIHFVAFHPPKEVSVRSGSLAADSLRRHPSNARSQGAYTKAELADLAASIREHGLLQPLVVTPDGDSYVILAGHRRHAALKLLKFQDASCIVLDANEQMSLAILLSDNGQHRPVDPLHEAEAVAKLVETLADQDHPHDRAAAVLGKSATWVRARLRLCTLSEAWRADARPEPLRCRRLRRRPVTDHRT